MARETRNLWILAFGLFGLCCLMADNIARQILPKDQGSSHAIIGQPCPECVKRFGNVIQ